MKTLLNLVRKAVPHSIKQLAKRVLGLPAVKIHPDWSILSSIGPNTQLHVVLDVGARNGWFLHNWKIWCPKAIVHAFEPDLPAYQKLANGYADDEGVYVSQYGVGEKESTETFYYMSGSEVSSSFLKHDQGAWDQLKYNTGDIEERQLKITSLDRYIEQEKIESVYLIKIDIQGYELLALKGATETLLKTDYLLIESSINPLYKNAAKFTEVHEYMVDQGFHMIDFRAWHRGNRVLMETDMLFRRNDLIKEIDDSSDVDRYYI